MFKPQSVSQPHVLKTIAVLPEGGQMPIFNGNGDINDFLRWVMTNIQYPKGLEDKPARVVINFTVQKDGTLGLFKVLEAPKEKAYEQTVIELLKRSPHWKPARLSDGEEVNMEVADLYLKHKEMGSSKQEFLKAAAQIPGVYVPSLYDVAYHEDGTIRVPEALRPYMRCDLIK